MAQTEPKAPSRTAVVAGVIFAVVLAAAAWKARRAGSPGAAGEGQASIS